MSLNCYRVWMKDGYAGLVNAENEDDAKALAIQIARNAINGAAMTRAEIRQAVTVDYVENLSSPVAAKA
jgi:hypothetical protein